MLVQIDPKITGYMPTQEVLSFGIETGIICGLKPRSIHDALIMVGGPLKGEFFLAYVLRFRVLLEAAECHSLGLYQAF